MYMTADGSKLANQGQKTIKGCTAEGVNVSMTYQVADVSRPLNSVGRITDMNNLVLFEQSGGWIINKSTGAQTRFHREDGVYVMRIWVPKRSGFTRQG